MQVLLKFQLQLHARYGNICPTGTSKEPAKWHLPWRCWRSRLLCRNSPVPRHSYRTSRPLAGAHIRSPTGPIPLQHSAQFKHNENNLHQTPVPSLTNMFRYYCMVANILVWLVTRRRENIKVEEYNKTIFQMAER